MKEDGSVIKNKYAKYVREVLDDRELYEQLMEECGELIQVSNKIIRSSGMSNNVTPASPAELEQQHRTESADVVSVLHLIRPNEAAYDYIDSYWKYQRWAERLGYKNEQEDSKMLDEETAKEYAKKLSDFCNGRDCVGCPFEDMNNSYCILDDPNGWRQSIENKEKEEQQNDKD